MRPRMNTVPFVGITSVEIHPALLCTVDEQIRSRNPLMPLFDALLMAPA